MFWLPLTFFRTLPFLHQYNERNMFRIWSTNSNFFVKKEDHARRSSIHKQGKTNIMSSCLLIFVRIIIIVKRRGLFICRHMLTPQSHFYKILSLRMTSTQYNNKRFSGKERDTNWPQYPENPISWKI